MMNFYRYTQPITPRQAQDSVAHVYQQLKRDLGSVADPIALHASVPELLAGAWAILRETLVAGQVPRSHKEAIAATVSTQNQCPWCVDIHGMMLSASGHSAASTAIVAHNTEAVTDPTLRALVVWAKQPRLTAPPGDPQLASELIGTAITFHYLNRMVNILLVEGFLPKSGLLRQALTATLPMILRPLAKRTVVSGEALRWLPDADLPADLSWAAANPNIAAAFAGFAHSSEMHGHSVLPESVRQLVLQQLTSWDGTAPGMSRAWVEQAVSGMRDSDAVAGRLLLLAGMASYQIDETLVQAFQRHYPGDATLVAALAWASFAAARQIGRTAHL